jgi:hypothetical protein
MRPLLALALAALPLAACGDDGSADPGPDAAAPLLEPPPAGEGRQLTMHVSLASGDETEQCQYVVVDEALEIARFEHVYTTGSHHLLLFQTGLAAADAPTEQFDCTGQQLTELGVSGIAYAAQVPDGELAYPADVALKVPAGTVLLVQTHYLNASPGDLDAEVRLNLWYTETPAAMEAGTLFFYDWAIVVPEGGTATARMQCQIPADIDLIFGMSHMHKRGVGYEAKLADPETMLFETSAWEGIEPRRYAPEQHIAAGSTIDFHCDYQGESGRTIIEGPSADANEMCMFVAAYYPRLEQPIELCAGPGSGPVFDGTQTCGQTVGCVRSAGDPLAAEQCLIDTCAASSQPAADLMMCMFYTCGEACDELGGACDQCVINNCGTQFNACQSATCE